MTENKIVYKEIDFAGKKLSLESGKLATMTNMSVKATFGETVLLLTAVAGEMNPEIDFFPLTINYQEKFYSSGSIKSSRFVKRDGRGTDDAIITGRVIDHAVRPLFPSDFYNEVQKDDNVHFHRGKVAKVIKDESSDKLIVEAENTLSGKLKQNPVEMVVLATGMQPNVKDLPIDNSYIDENGFLKNNEDGMIGCGVSVQPKEVASVVQEATGAVLKAIQKIKGN